MLSFLRQNWIVLALIVALLGVAKSENDKAHDACIAARDTAIEVNKRTDALTTLRNATLKFDEETRNARANPHGTSYDPHFVGVIDAIEPDLKAIKPVSLPLKNC